MAIRGKVSMYTIFLVVAIGTIGLLSFQGLKERKNSTMLLKAKNKKIDDLKNQYEVGSFNHFYDIKIIFFGFNAF